VAGGGWDIYILGCVVVDVTNDMTWVYTTYVTVGCRGNYICMYDYMHGCVLLYVWLYRRMLQVGDDRTESEPCQGCDWVCECGWMGG